MSEAADPKPAKEDTPAELPKDESTATATLEPETAPPPKTSGKSTKSSKPKALAKADKPMDAKSIIQLPIESIKSYDNPRQEPAKLHELGYSLFGDPNVELPDPKKGKYVSLSHMALSADMQRVEAFVKLVEEHESIDREAHPDADQSIVELAADIKMYKQLVPVAIRKGRHGLVLGDGGRRVAAILYLFAKSRVDIAAKQAGAPKKEWPAVVEAVEIDCKEDELFMISVNINLSRKEFTEVQQARLYHEIKRHINPETGKRYSLKEVAELVKMPYGTVRYREALAHPYNPKTKKGLTDEDRRAVEEGKMNPSFAAKKSLGERVQGTGNRKKTKQQPLTLKAMADLFDKTPAHNKERRKAIAECMGMTLDQATKESMARTDDRAESQVRRLNRKNTKNARRRGKAA